MKGLFWALGAFALAVGISLALRENDGYALLVLPPYRVELSLAFLLVLLLAAFIVAYAVARLIFRMMDLPAKVRAFRQRQHEENAQNALLGALQALFEGRFSRAERLATRAWDLGAPNPQTNLQTNSQMRPAVSLIAARAAQRVRNTERRDLWLNRADDAGKSAGKAHGADWSQAAQTIRGELLVDERDWDSARPVLRGLHDSGPKHIATLLLLLRAEQGLGNWEEVVRLARLLEKRSGLPTEALERILINARIALLQRRTHDPRSLAEHWRDIPERERRHPKLAMAAAGAYIQHGDCRSAHRIVEETLAHNWSASLVLLYGECLDDDALQRIERAEVWLKTRPRDWPLLLTLGRLCAQRQLWGKAQSYLEASVAVQPTRAAHIALAELFDHIGRVHDANRHYRAAADSGLTQGTAEN